jgi:prepilin-type N-terminal cleavage/methylation domain-containing protein
MMKDSPTTQKGFTLVETLVSITLLLIVITGPMTISMTTARSTSFASEQVVAFFLAQEGAELAQMARDELILQAVFFESGWGVFSDNTAGADYYSCFKATGCGLELNTNSGGTLKTGSGNAFKDCETDADKCRLYYDTTTHKRARYTYDSSGGKVATPYSRSITFYQENDWDVKVVSKITWRTGTQLKEQEVKVETHLFDIYEEPTLFFIPAI